MKTKHKSLLSKMNTLINNLKFTMLLTITGTLVLSCSSVSNIDVRNHVDQKLTIENHITGHKYYVSNIYRDKELGELFWEKSEDDIFQVTDDKQNISTIILNPTGEKIYYGQSQESNKFSKALEGLVINSPYRFSDYLILSYSLKRNKKDTIFNLSEHKIVGTVQNMGLLNDENTLAFQTHYGEIYFLDLNNSTKAEKFIPEINLPDQFEFEDFYNLRTEGNDKIIFDAASGYKSNSNTSFVYNTYIYNLNSHQVSKISNNPFYFRKPLGE